MALVIITIFFAASLYTAMAFFTYYRSNELIDVEFDTYSTDKDGSKNLAFCKKVRLNKKFISILSAIGWPFAYSFMIGYELLGREVFNTLTKEHEEDRIAAWFI